MHIHQKKKKKKEKSTVIHMEVRRQRTHIYA